jgi:hypothetical protein
MLTTTTRANNARGVFDARARRFRVRRRLANERAREIDGTRTARGRSTTFDGTDDEVGL